MAAKSLLATEAARLVECERIIADGIDRFMAVGNALTEIRDGKLYRASHKTFEAYCQERWELGRSRAYEIIDHAKVVSAINDAVGDCPPVADISKRDVRAVKGDVEAVVEDIKARREAGEAPEDAAKNAIEAKRKEQAEEKQKAADAAAEAKRRREAEQAENERQREEAASGFSEAIKARAQVRADAIAASKAGTVAPPEPGKLEESDRIAELEEEVRALDAEVNRLKASLSEDEELERMRSEWRAGGWDKVIEKLKADHAFDVGVLKRQVETESADKVAYMRGRDFFKRKAQEHGWSNFEDIDLREGANG